MYFFCCMQAIWFRIICVCVWACQKKNENDECATKTYTNGMNLLVDASRFRYTIDSKSILTHNRLVIENCEKSWICYCVLANICMSLFGDCKVRIYVFKKIYFLRKPINSIPMQNNCMQTGWIEMFCGGKRSHSLLHACIHTLYHLHFIWPFWLNFLGSIQFI